MESVMTELPIMPPASREVASADRQAPSEESELKALLAEHGVDPAFDSHIRLTKRVLMCVIARSTQTWIGLAATLPVVMGESLTVQAITCTSGIATAAMIAILSGAG